MLFVTSAVTPKGERRRGALVSAAADLLCEGGFEAVRHRAVARRAGLPLASTTYQSRLTVSGLALKVFMTATRKKRLACEKQDERRGMIRDR